MEVDSENKLDWWLWKVSCLLLYTLNILVFDWVGFSLLLAANGCGFAGGDSHD